MRTFVLLPSLMWRLLRVRRSTSAWAVLSVLVTFAAAITPRLARGQDCIDYGDYMHWVGGVQGLNAVGVEVVGSYAFVIEAEGEYWGGRFVVIDISTPSAPTIAGSLWVRYGSSVAVAGTYAYVTATRQEGWFGIPCLYVIDVSDPTSPAIIGSIDVRGAAVAVAGNCAYVVDDVEGLKIIDVSSPVSPALVGSIETPGVSLAVADSYVYVAGDAAHGLQIVEASDPTSPVLVGALINGCTFSGMAASAGYAYVTSYLTSGRFQVIDVSSPASPEIIGSVEAWGRSVAVAGSYAYVAGNLRVIDITDPAAPVIVGSFPGSFNDVATVGNHTYLAAGICGGGFMVIDVANPLSAPDSIGRVDTPGSARDVVVAGRYAYVTDGSALQVIDINDPTFPAIVGSVTTPAGDVAVGGGFAYVVGGNRLYVIDISNPSAPAIAGSVAVSQAYYVALAGDHAYVACGSHGLRIIDISNPTAPAIVGEAGPGWIYAVAAAGDYVYVATAVTSTAIIIIDVSNPTSPAIVGSAPTGSYGHDIAVADGYAYVAYGDIYAPCGSSGGLDVFDVSNPSAPQRLGEVQTPFEANGVDVVRDQAYVADADGGLQIVGLTDRAAPAILGGAFASERARGVAVAGDYAYVASDSGLAIFPVQCEEPTAIDLSAFGATLVQGGILLTWSTSRECDHLGFRVHRSFGADGEYVRLSELIEPPGAYQFLDTDITAGATYYYRLEAVDRSGGSEFYGPVEATAIGAAASRFTLSQNQPNPFVAERGATAIGFTLGEPTQAKLQVFDSAGRVVCVLVDAPLDAGPHTVSWDGRNDGGAAAGSGIYYYRLDAGAFSEARTLVRLK